ncbi:cytochrome c oxidase, subunit II [Brucella abortus str. 2308 A]|nr:cytochrome c oxidase, subunit II [Brucella abortus str. 2308 A]
MIPAVASIVTRHVKANLSSNHGCIMGVASFSQVFVGFRALWQSPQLREKGRWALCRAQKCRTGTYSPSVRCALRCGLNADGDKAVLKTGVQPERAKRERVLVDKIVAATRGAMGGALAVLWTTGAALADQPRPWEWRFQDAATGIAEQIHWFERYTLWFIIPITLLVLGLLVWVVLRFRASVNPEPSKTSHNTAIEVIWTVGPVIILLFLAVPSFQLLTAQYSPEDPTLTVKATGYQWYWGYEYQVDNPVSFDSVILKDDDRAAAGKEDRARYSRLLTVDNEVVVPVGETVRLLVTASDVIHSWTIPAFGVKMDAVPGRINETWFKADKEGLYYGQCSELCGKDHGFMPIAVRVVSKDQYQNWLSAAATDLPGANKALLQAEGEGSANDKVAAAGL